MIIKTGDIFYAIDDCILVESNKPDPMYHHFQEGDKVSVGHVILYDDNPHLIQFVNLKEFDDDDNQLFYMEFKSHFITQREHRNGVIDSICK